MRCRAITPEIGGGLTHNLKVVGSNPTPATKISPADQALAPGVPGFFMPVTRFKTVRGVPAIATEPIVS